MPLAISDYGSNLAFAICDTATCTIRKFVQQATDFYRESQTFLPVNVSLILIAIERAER